MFQIMIEEIDQLIITKSIRKKYKNQKVVFGIWRRRL